MKYTVDVLALKKIMVECRLDKIIELSKASGVNRNTISKILNNEMKPSTTVIEKLMRALGISSEDAGKIFFNENLRDT